MNKLFVLVGVLSILASLSFASFSGIGITDFEGGLSNQVKMNVYADSNDTISTCYIRTVNSINEDKYYWQSDINSNAMNRTIIFEKAEESKFKLYCVDGSSTASTDFVSVKGKNAIENWYLLIFLIMALDCLYLSLTKNSTLLIMISAIAWLIFIKLFEACFFNLIPDYMLPIMILKIAFAFILTSIIFQRFLDEISKATSS
jgi:hypothetical protein